jgi:hypothetical protein
MKRLAVPLTVAALLATAGTASAAGTAVKYKGKTDSGHPITFSIKNKRVVNLEAGIRVSCIPIQGGGAPTGGSEVFGFEGSVPLGQHASWSFMSKPAFHYNEVTMNHDLWIDRRSKRSISGRTRIQYQFMIPKYPIGTFTIYSCLGSGSFTAKAR